MTELGAEPLEGDGFWMTLGGGALLRFAGPVRNVTSIKQEDGSYQEPALLPL